MSAFQPLGMSFQKQTCMEQCFWYGDMALSHTSRRRHVHPQTNVRHALSLAALATCLDLKSNFLPSPSTVMSGAIPMIAPSADIGL
jgi:hypothetical protein